MRPAAILDTQHTLLTDIGLLILRLWAGLAMFFAHGWAKFADFGERADTFPDPLGIGSPASLALATFAEALCSLLVAAGLLTRLAAVPLVVTMLAATYTHVFEWGDAFGDYELALFFAATFALFLLAGPGRFSIDAVIGRVVSGGRP